MSEKNTPSGRALEAFNSKLSEYAAFKGVFNANHLNREEVETIRTALLRSHAIESGELVPQLKSGDDFAVSDYAEGFNNCLERLKGIGHDDR